jgi:predicted YcjX-like family ATPase
MTASAQFAPLTGKARAANPHLLEPFRRHYDAYRESVGEAMAKDFYACDNLVVLIDIAAVLEGGPKTFYATRNCVKQLLTVLDPGLTNDQFLTKIALQIITAGREGAQKIDHVAFVATKADVIHSHHRHRLLALLNAITEDLLPPESGQRWMSHRSFVAAAIQAAEDADPPPRVKGYVRQKGKLELQVLPVPLELPTEWPPESGWKEGEYVYGGFEPPPLDKNGTEFWAGFGMDALVEYLGLLSV